MSKLVNEFKAFAFRGNLLDLAVAVILGLAFNAVIMALVDGILLQITRAWSAGRTSTISQPTSTARPCATDCS